MPNIVGMSGEFLIHFGAMLKALREERRITQQKLGNFAGVERNYIYYIEKGKSEPTLGVLMGLAKGLNLSFAEFAAMIEKLPRDAE